MNHWIISDTHFNHEKLDFWGQRSGDWQEQLYAGIEALPKEDVLIHLGDICIGNDSMVHKRLMEGAPRTRILVRGNHDKATTTWYYEHGWTTVVDGLELLFHGHYLHLTHRPARPQGHAEWNIHGHTHGNSHRSEEHLDYYSDLYHIDISPEIRGYKPLKLQTLVTQAHKRLLQTFLT